MFTRYLSEPGEGIRPKNNNPQTDISRITVPLGRSASLEFDRIQGRASPHRSGI